MNSLIINRFDKSFGPAGSFAGLILILTGVIAMFFSFSGIFVLILGTFVAFTHSSILIDTENKKVKFTQNICGIFKMGRWVDIEPEMHIRITKNNVINRVYSQSNRSLDIKNKIYRIYLFSSSHGNEKIPLKFASSYDDALQSALDLAKKLDIEFIQ